MKNRSQEPGVRSQKPEVRSQVLVYSFWFLVKKEKPETTNQRPENKSLW